jgi:hypothetical protein
MGVGVYNKKWFTPITFLCLSQVLDFQRHMSWSYYFQLLKVVLSTINHPTTNDWGERWCFVLLINIDGIIDHGCFNLLPMIYQRRFENINCILINVKCDWHFNKTVKSLFIWTTTYDAGNPKPGKGTKMWWD